MPLPLASNNVDCRSPESRCSRRATVVGSISSRRAASATDPARASIRKMRRSSQFIHPLLTCAAAILRHLCSLM
jgi:hypothetical protein